MADEEQNSETTFSKTSFPIVGIGASAGGLDALKQLFGQVGKNTGIAYVVISHMAKNQPSLLPELLQRVTDVPVKMFQDGEKIQKNTIYINPPGKEISIYQGSLQLFDTSSNTVTKPIDNFFKTLAIEKGKDAVAVILSGTGTDGTAGIKEIKKHEGIVIVQDVETADYDGMPSSAIASGMVDKVVEADKIGSIIESCCNALPEETQDASPDKSSGPDELNNNLGKIFVILRTQTGHDFSAYKTNTILRRITRRMGLNQISDFSLYIRFLQENKSEVSDLFQELLIGVTNFFRDPESFKALEKEVLIDLIGKKAKDSSFRVWIPGCSTGEEAYSIAILLHECMEATGNHLNLQVFGTDINNQAIEKARQGIYPASIASDVGNDRLGRYFIRDGESYQISKLIRDIVIFSAQDIVKDPPFSKLDLLCCRNLLIYLNNPSQKKLLPLFHYTLNPDGVLLLGSSETVGGFTSLFEPINKKWKIFKRKEVPPGLHQIVDFPSGTVSHISNGVTPANNDTKVRTNFEQITKDLILKNIGPTAVLIDSVGEVLYLYGNSSKFLEHPEGHPTRNLVDMARSGLSIELSAAIRSAKSAKSNVIRKGITVKVNGETIIVDIQVCPQSEGETFSGLLLVIFIEVTPANLDTEEVGSKGKIEPEDHQRLSTLEKELQSTRESHQCTIEELESSNEELKSTNEELQSSNEELQSTNEELESSKEELQSLNEEMQTVNSELQSKVEELSATHDDMRNLLNSTEIASIFVDNEMLIRRFTAESEKIINLIHSDIGRPLKHVVSNLSYDKLIEDCSSVLQGLVPVEKEVQVQKGGWYAMRIIPYRTIDNKIDGAVLTFTDIQDQKKVSEKLGKTVTEYEQAWKLVRTVFDMNIDPLAVLNTEGQFVISNTAMEELLGLGKDTAIGKGFLELLNVQEQPHGSLDRFTERLQKQVNFTTEAVVIQLEDTSQLYSIECSGIDSSQSTPFRFLVRMVKNRKT